MKTADLNLALSNLYTAFIPTLKDSLVEKNTNLDALSLPLLMNVFEDYTKVQNRLLIVGRETFGWGSFTDRDGKFSDEEKLNVSYLMKFYERFELGKHYINSPFWQFARKINQKLNPNASDKSFLWTNLFKVDEKRTTPSEEVKKILMQHTILQEEIKIIQPQIVIFTTAYTNDDCIRILLKDKECLKIIETRFLARLTHPDFPENSFRTYHPHFLRRAKKTDKVIEEISKNLRN